MPSKPFDISPSVRDRLVESLHARADGLLAVYAFGSRLTGTAHRSSDLDMAVLVAGYADPLLLWHWSCDLADIAGCPVDVLDFRAASTVMHYRILTTGTRWWEMDSQAAIFESAILSEKTALDTARAGLLADIAQRGSVYAR